MKIYGHCRFSYFGLSDTGRAITTIDHAQTLLWNPVRMAARFHLFEQILLPALRNQTDPDFVFQLITSTPMPEVYKERLADLVADTPQIRVLCTDDMDLGSALLGIIAEASDGHSQPAIHFRLDDDDAVCTQYIARIRAASQRVDPGGMISFSSGVIGFLDGDAARHCAHIHPYIAIGLALINEPLARLNPFRIRHAKYANYVPSYVDPTFPAFHYTLHSVNNTSGYAQTFQTAGDRNERIGRAIQRNPELAEGGVTTELAELHLARAFPYTNGAHLRQVILDTARPNELAERLGLPRG